MNNTLQNYCEKYGIIPHKINGNTLVYYANYRENGKPYTIKCTVKVKNGAVTENRVILKRFNKCGYDNYLM